MRLAFMGTPDFAVPSLEALIAAGREVAAVYCQPPRRAGRGHRERPSPVQVTAERHGLPVRTPASLKDPAAQADFAALELDVAVVAAYGLILPRPILEAPRHGCINIHASLLPRWRGAAPIQRAIMAGDTETGICIMRMEAGLDTGPVLLSGRVPIDDETTGGSLHDVLARLGAELIVPALEGLADGTLTETPQDDARATYAHKLTREDGRIDWTAPAGALERLVRALAPRPGAWTEHDGTALRILAATSLPGRRDAVVPGTVLDARPAVACGNGALLLERLQRPGGAAMPADVFLRGYALPPGTRLAPCPATG